jgi:hypothetical protein
LESTSTTAATKTTAAATAASNNQVLRCQRRQRRQGSRCGERVDGVCAISCDDTATELLCANVGDDYDTGAAVCTRNSTAATSTR